MKKLFIYIMIAFLVLTLQQVNAQRIIGSVIGGMNLAQVDGDEVYGYNKFGLNIGASATVPLGKNFTVTLENIYNQKGAFQSEQYSDSLNGAYRLKLYYLEVPLLIQYTDKDFFTAGAGFSWGRLVKSSEVENGGASEPYIDEVPFNNNDYNIIADLRFPIYRRLKANIRYSYSVSKIRTREFNPPYSNDQWTRNQFNNYLSFRVIWMFNEKLENKQD